MRRALAVVAPVLMLATAAPAAAESSYALDAIPRELEPHGRVDCPAVDLVTYRGTTIRYHKPVRIYVGFEDSLQRFEALARDTAIEVYGRAPKTLRHAGAYNCRRVRTIATLLSEHSLGNAIDVEGFDFAAAPRGVAAPAGLRRAFQVRVGRHWTATKGVGATHARFLRLLAERVIAADLFHVVLGPSYPGHQSHFHFDLAPYRLVDVFGDDPAPAPTL